MSPGSLVIDKVVVFLYGPTGLTAADGAPGGGGVQIVLTGRWALGNTEGAFVLSGPLISMFLVHPKPSLA